MSMLSGVDCFVSVICPSSIDGFESDISPSSMNSSLTLIIVCAGVL